MWEVRMRCVSESSGWKVVAAYAEFGDADFFVRNVNACDLQAVFVPGVEGAQ